MCKKGKESIGWRGMGYASAVGLLWCLCEVCEEELYGQYQDPTTIVDQLDKGQLNAGLTSKEEGSKVVPSGVGEQESKGVK